MMRFIKDLNLKFISLLITVLFILNSTVYGIDLSNKSHLRVPSSFQDQAKEERLEKALLELSNEAVGEVIIEDLKKIRNTFPLWQEDSSPTGYTPSIAATELQPYPARGPHSGNFNSRAVFEWVTIFNLVDDGVKRLLLEVSEEIKKRGDKLLILSASDSTGGVAGTRREIVGMLQFLGISVDWIIIDREIIPGTGDIIGTFYHAVDGHPEELTESQIDQYQEAMRRNLEAIDLSERTVVFVDDIHCAGLLPLIRKTYPHLKIVWYCPNVIANATNKAKGLLKEWTAAADIILEIGPGQVSDSFLSVPMAISPPSIDPTSLINREISEEFKEAVVDHFGIDRERPIVLFGGGYHIRKDPLTALAAFNLAYTTLKSTSKYESPQLILMATEARARSILQEVLTYKSHLEAEDDIHVLISNLASPPLTKDESMAISNMGLGPDALDWYEICCLRLNAFIKLADLVIVPAIYDGFGTFTTCTLLAGKVVVGTATPGALLQVEDGKTGFIVPLTEEDTLKTELAVSALCRGDVHEAGEILKSRAATQGLASLITEILTSLGGSELSQISSQARKSVKRRFLTPHETMGILLITWAVATPEILEHFSYHQPMDKEKLISLYHNWKAREEVRKGFSAGRFSMLLIDMGYSVAPSFITDRQLTDQLVDKLMDVIRDSTLALDPDSLIFRQGERIFVAFSKDVPEYRVTRYAIGLKKKMENIGPSGFDIESPEDKERLILTIGISRADSLEEALSYVDPSLISLEELEAIYYSSTPGFEAVEAVVGYDFSNFSWSNPEIERIAQSLQAYGLSEFELVAAIPVDYGELRILRHNTSNTLIVEKPILEENRDAIEQLISARIPGTLPTFLVPGIDDRYYEVYVPSLRYSLLGLTDQRPDMEVIRPEVRAILCELNAVGLSHCHPHPWNIFVSNDGKKVILFDSKRLKKSPVNFSQIRDVWESDDFSEMLDYHLAGADLRGLPKPRQNINFAFWGWVNMQDVHWPGVRMIGVTFIGSEMNGAQLSEADFRFSTFLFTDFKRVNLQKARFNWAIFKFANLEGTNLKEADLSYANATKTDFTNASLVGADLRVADLTGSKFVGADLRGANLSWAVLKDIVLHNTIVSEGQMQQLARETGARFYYEDSRNVWLASNITTSNLEDSREDVDSETSATLIGGTPVTGRRQHVDKENKIITVLADKALANKSEFIQFVANQRQEHAVVLIARTRQEYDEAIEMFGNLVWVKILDTLGENLEGIPEEMIMRDIVWDDISRVLGPIDTGIFDNFNLGQLDDRIDEKVIKAIAAGV